MAVFISVSAVDRHVCTSPLNQVAKLQKTGEEASGQASNIVCIFFRQQRRIHDLRKEVREGPGSLEDEVPQKSMIFYGVGAYCVRRQNHYFVSLALETAVFVQ